MSTAAASSTAPNMNLAKRRQDKARLPARSAERGRFALTSAANVATPSQLGYRNPQPGTNFLLIFRLRPLAIHVVRSMDNFLRLQGVCGSAGASGAPPHLGKPHRLNRTAKL